MSFPWAGQEYVTGMLFPGQTAMNITATSRSFSWLEILFPVIALKPWVSPKPACAPGKGEGARAFRCSRAVNGDSIEILLKVIEFDQTDSGAAVLAGENGCEGTGRQSGKDS